MTENEFRNAVISRLSAKDTFDNPGGGTSKVMKVGPGKISYVRGSSTYYIPISAIYKVYCEFAGRKVSTTDLIRSVPTVFDELARPAGHTCNRTFCLCVLHKLGLSSAVQGAGKPGNPFFVNVHVCK